MEGEELLDLQALVSRIDTQCSVKEYISNENDVTNCSGLIDRSHDNWREAVEAELLEDDDELPDDIPTEKDYDFDEEVEPSPIKSLTVAMNVAKQLWHFAQFNGHQGLVLSLAKSNDLIYALKLQAPKLEMSLEYYFK